MNSASSYPEFYKETLAVTELLWWAIWKKFQSDQVNALVPWPHKDHERWEARNEYDD